MSPQIQVTFDNLDSGQPKQVFPVDTQHVQAVFKRANDATTTLITSSDQFQVDELPEDIVVAIGTPQFVSVTGADDPSGGPYTILIKLSNVVDVTQIDESPDQRRIALDGFSVTVSETVEHLTALLWPAL